MSQKLEQMLAEVGQKQIEDFESFRQEMYQLSYDELKQKFGELYKEKEEKDWARQFGASRGGGVAQEDQKIIETLDRKMKIIVDVMFEKVEEFRKQQE